MPAGKKVIVLECFPELVFMGLVRNESSEEWYPAIRLQYSPELIECMLGLLDLLDALNFTPQVYLDFTAVPARVVIVFQMVTTVEQFKRYTTAFASIETGRAQNSQLNILLPIESTFGIDDHRTFDSSFRSYRSFKLLVTEEGGENGQIHWERELNSVTYRYPSTQDIKDGFNVATER